MWAVIGIIFIAGYILHYLTSSVKVISQLGWLYLHSFVTQCFVVLPGNALLLWFFGVWPIPLAKMYRSAGALLAESLHL